MKNHQKLHKKRIEVDIRKISKVVNDVEPSENIKEKGKVARNVNPIKNPLDLKEGVPSQT